VVGLSGDSDLENGVRKEKEKETMAKNEAPIKETPDGGTAKGQPSSHLQRLMAAQAAGSPLLDTSKGDTYEFMTDPQPEKGIYRLVGGYVDKNGELHNDVELRAMSGDEEDLLGNDRVPFMLIMNSIMGSCVKRLGNISDEGSIRRAINDMPSGTRTDLMIYLRVTSHWKAVKDEYEMELRCPARDTCGQESTHKINLLSLDRFQPKDPTKQEYVTELADANMKATWRVMTGDYDLALDVIADSTEHRKNALSWAILVRLLYLGDQRVDLDVTDLLSRDRRKAKLSKKAQQWLKIVKALSVHDRDTLRADFLDAEPGVDTDLTFTCPHCNLDFEGRLRVGQPAFFFPQATSRRLKRKRST